MTFPREGAFQEEIKERRGCFPSITVFFLLNKSFYLFLPQKKIFIYIYIFEQVPSKVGGVDGDIDIMTRWW